MCAYSIVFCLDACSEIETS